MELLWAIVIFVFGIILIVKGGDWFVDSATWIARAAKIPAFIIGATIVGFATSLPELIVSVVASIQGKNDMAVGNAVGSVIANTGLIMAIALVFMNLVTPRKDYWQQCLLLLACCAILWVGSLQGALTLWASLIMLVICIAFVAISVIQGRQEMNLKRPLELDNHAEKQVTKKDNKLMIINKKTIWKNVFFFFLGAACVILGSDFLIDGGSTIATSLHVPERLIAITLVAVGTSLPELVTTVVAVRKKEGGLMAGNIIGSNIIDLTLILPVCNFVSNGSFPVSNQCLMIDFPFLLGLSLIAIIPMLCKQRTYKWQGIFMLICYASYITVSAIC